MHRLPQVTSRWTCRRAASGRWFATASRPGRRRCSARARGDATLLAALWELELDASDNALVLLDGLLNQLLSLVPVLWTSRIVLVDDDRQLGAKDLRDAALATHLLAIQRELRTESRQSGPSR